MTPIVFAVVGADVLTRDLLVQALPQCEPRLSCALNVSCRAEAVPRCTAAGPDLVVFDLRGSDAADLRILRELGQTTARWGLLVIVSGAADRSLAELVLRRGCGMLSRQSSLDELARAAVLVSGGGTYLDAALHGLLEHGPAPAATPHLSQRERHVLQLVAEGCSTKEVAGRLDLSIKTVDKYRTSVMQKLAVHDVVKLTHYAIRMGFVTVAPWEEASCRPMG